MAHWGRNATLWGSCVVNKPRPKETIAIGSGGVTVAGASEEAKPSGGWKPPEEVITVPGVPPADLPRADVAPAHVPTRIVGPPPGAAEPPAAAVPTRIVGPPHAADMSVPSPSPTDTTPPAIEAPPPPPPAASGPAVAPFQSVPAPESFGRAMPPSAPVAPPYEHPLAPPPPPLPPPASPPMAHPPYPQPPHQGGMPPAPKPSGRTDELAVGAGNTIYEFTGAHGDADTRRGRGTFIGGSDLDLSSMAAERETNLSSGASTWIFLVLVVLLGGGAVVWFVLFAPDEPQAQPAVAAAEEDEPEATPEAEADPDAEKAAADADADAKAAEEEKAAADAKAAEEAKAAADAKAAEEAKAAADAKAAEDAKAEAPPEEPPTE